MPVVPPVDITWCRPDHLPEPLIYIQSSAEKRLDTYTTEEAPEKVKNNKLLPSDPHPINLWKSLPSVPVEFNL